MVTVYGKARRWIDSALGCFASYKFISSRTSCSAANKTAPRLTGRAALVYLIQIAGALKMRLKRDFDPSGAAATDFLFQAWSSLSDPRDLRAACIRVTKC